MIDRKTYDCDKCEATGLGYGSGNAKCTSCHGRGFHFVPENLDDDYDDALNGVCCQEDVE